MNRIYEELESSVVLAPASVNSATETTTDYVSGAKFDSIDFHVQLASLPDTKILSVALYAADDASGTNAVKVGETTFTASGALTKVLAVVSADVAGDRKPYYGVKFQHDAGSPVICAVSAHGRTIYGPAANARVLTL